MLGTFAFALSGIRFAAAKHFDMLGAWTVGLATAVGGGTIRDIMLGLEPFWITNTSYIICTTVALICVMMFSKYLARLNSAWFIFDTIGLALFNVIGIEKTINMGLPSWTAVAMGCITGVAGGIMRDILINEMPLIFRKEIYAMACIAGGVIYTICHHFGVMPALTAIISIVTVVTIRTLSVANHWHLPLVKPRPDDMHTIE